MEGRKKKGEREGEGREGGKERKKESLSQAGKALYLLRRLM
jgi:hypothetical protein